MNPRLRFKLNSRARDEIASLIGLNTSSTGFNEMIYDLECAVIRSRFIQAQSNHRKRSRGGQENEARGELCIAVADIFEDHLCGPWRIQGMDAGPLALSKDRNSVFARLLKIVLRSAGYNGLENMRNLTEKAIVYGRVPDDLTETEKAALIEQSSDDEYPLQKIMARCDWTEKNGKVKCARYLSGTSMAELGGKLRNRGWMSYKDKHFCPQHKNWRK